MFLISVDSFLQDNLTHLQCVPVTKVLELVFHDLSLVPEVPVSLEVPVKQSPLALDLAVCHFSKEKKK
jgi:hypothetical protein